MRQFGTTLTIGLAVSLVLAAAGGTLPAPPTPRVRKDVEPAQPRVAKSPTKIVVENAAGVAGETRPLKAVLATISGGDSLAGKSVSFRIEGKGGSSVPGGGLSVGSAVTDGSGRAQVSFKLPELAQDNYAIKATYDGDDSTFGSTGEGNLLMVKAVTKIELSNLIWSTYKNESGPPSGSFTAKVLRTSDNATLNRPVTVTVNGDTWNYSSSQQIHSFPLPNGNSGPSPWQVHVQFEGDAAYAASAAQITYVQPN